MYEIKTDGRGLDFEFIWYCPKCKETRGTDHNGLKKCIVCDSKIISITIYVRHILEQAKKKMLIASKDTARVSDMKGDILNILTKELSISKDELLRAKIKFNKMSTRQLSKEFAKSGITNKGVFSIYKNRYEKIRRCISWLRRI